jgi:hypothetical protein
VDGRVKSLGVGYEAIIPPGWRLRPNILTSPDYRGDAYFKPDTATPDPDRQAPNIAVGCGPILASPGTLDEVVDAQAEALEGLKREDIRARPRMPIDGREARQIEYVFRLSSLAATPVPPTPAADQPHIVLDKRDVVFLSDGCIWTVSLSAPQGTIDAESPVFEQFLSSFKATR